MAGRGAGLTGLDVRMSAGVKLGLGAVLPEAGTPARVDMHSGSAAAMGGWLAERGLAARPPSPVMVAGEDLPWNPAMLLCPVMQALG